MSPSPWMECANGHQNLRSTINENGGKCPQCGSRKLKSILSPQIGEAKPDKFMAMAERLVYWVDVRISKHEENIIKTRAVAAALRRVDKVAFKRGYESRLCACERTERGGASK